MAWDELLLRFRALGGTADNLILRSGPRGRGLFAIDPARPVRLHVPATLLVPTDDVELRDGHLVVKPSAPVGDRERAFFDDYQRYFSWGLGAFDDLWREQTGWAALPQAVKNQILAMGVPEHRFAAPSPALCLHLFLNTRSIPHDGRSKVMPVMELINHAVTATPYRVDSKGLLVEGLYADEILVRYGIGDAWSRATVYGFAAPVLWGHSLPLVHLADNLRISISRTFSQTSGASPDGVPVPAMRREGDMIALSFLMLGYRDNMDAPTAIFERLIPGLGRTASRRAFNRIQHFNRGQFYTLLRLLDEADGGIMSMLKTAVLHQLEAISAYC